MLSTKLLVTEAKLKFLHGTFTITRFAAKAAYEVEMALQKRMINNLQTRTRIAKDAIRDRLEDQAADAPINFVLTDEAIDQLVDYAEAEMFGDLENEQPSDSTPPPYSNN